MTVVDGRQVILLVLLTLALPAAAQGGWRERHPYLAEHQAERQAERQERRAERQAWFERRAAGNPEEWDRADRPRRGRLTLEERRQLRRDIHEAGAGLYRRPPPPPPPPVPGPN
jgi:hypothetical protein